MAITMRFVLFAALVAAVVMTIPLSRSVLEHRGTGKSVVFEAQAKVAYDSIYRYERSDGIITSAARQDAQKAVDNLARMSHNDADEAAVRVLTDYISAIDLFRMRPDKEAKTRLVTANVAAQGVCF